MHVNLVMFKPNGQRKDFPLINDSTILGRAENCDLRIPLLSVSRQHCELVKNGQTLTARDLASSNGTYVNNQRVNEAKLQAGDRLVVGPIVFTVQIDGQPEEIQAVKTRGQVLAEQTHAGGEEIVKLEAELTVELGGSGLDETSVTPARGQRPADQADPMAALEEMASQDEQPPKEDDQ